MLALYRALAVWYSGVSLAEVAKWQTRMPQEHVGATPWRFKSSLPHSRP